MKIGLKIRELRVKNHLTQEQLGNIIGITDKGISKWERGTSWPDLFTVVKLADYFKVSLDYLLRDEIPLESEELAPCDGFCDFDNLEKDDEYFINVKDIVLHKVVSTISYLSYLLEGVNNNEYKLSALKDEAIKLINSKEYMFLDQFIGKRNREDIFKVNEVVDIITLNLDENNFKIKYELLKQMFEEIINKLEHSVKSKKNKK